MEIINSRISVYEIELDLGNWKYHFSNEISGFHQQISQILPSLQKHKCMRGREGGFFEELKEGTNLAHVIEHILLELLYLSDTNGHIYKGWTRKTSNTTYIIHYGAPDFLKGGLAAILSVDLIKKLIDHQQVILEDYIDQLRQPIQYFSQESTISSTLSNLVETSGSKPIEKLNHKSLTHLTKVQEKNIQQKVDHLNDQHFFISKIWREAFIEYSGKFGASIINKVELLNLNKYQELIAKGNFSNIFRGIKNISQVLKSYHIPIHFVHHSVWLYKNSLLTSLMDRIENNETEFKQAIQDFELFYQHILHKINEGFREPVSSIPLPKFDELREIREMKEGEGLILIVDDDDMILKTCTDILEFHCYKVITAKNGTEALDVFMKEKDAIDIMILDFQMPDMNGLDVLKKIKHLTDKCEVILTSGYPLQPQIEEEIKNNNVFFLKKPFHMDNLLKSVNDLIRDQNPHPRLSEL